MARISSHAAPAPAYREALETTDAAATADAREYATLLAQRTRHLVEVREPLALISQVQRSGGSLLSQLFDGHPEIHAHPHELHTGYPKKHTWPPLVLDDGPAEWFRLLSEPPAERAFREGYQKQPKGHERLAGGSRNGNSSALTSPPASLSWPLGCF